jgi:hypothetical protein
MHDLVRQKPANRCSERWWKRCIISVSTLSGCLISTFAHTSFAQIPAQLNNPGFEVATIAGWETSGPASTVAGAGHAGNRSAQLAKGSSLQQVVGGLKPATVYVLSAWLRRSDATGIGHIGVKDYGGAQLAASTTSPAFTPLTVIFKTGASSRVATIYVRAESGNVLADDFHIAEQNQAYATPLDGSLPLRTLWVSPNGNDSFPGTAADRPKRTINAALVIATPGTAIRVRAGTYNGYVKFKKLATTPAQPVWLLSHDGIGRAKIAAGQRDVFQGYGVSNILISGFHIMGATRHAFTFGQAPPLIADVGDANANVCRNVVLKNNFIENTGSDAIKFSGCVGVHVLYNRIFKADLHDPEESIDSVAVNNLIIAGNTINDTRDGIVVKAGSDNVLIADNKLFGVQLNGISGGGWSDEKYMWRKALSGRYEASRVTIRRNEVQAKDKLAIVTLACATCVVEGNRVHANTYPTGDVGISGVPSSVHGQAWYSRSVTVRDNCVERARWLFVKAGNASGFSQYDNNLSGCN